MKRGDMSKMVVCEGYGTHINRKMWLMFAMLKVVVELYIAAF